MVLDFVFDELDNVFLVIFHSDFYGGATAKSIFDITVRTARYEDFQRPAADFHEIVEDVDQLLSIGLATLIQSVDNHRRAGEQIQ